jgi:hypothetical protein
MEPQSQVNLIERQTVESHVETLRPVFIPSPAVSLDFLSALLRVSGWQDEGWDALYESRAMLDDLHRLVSVDLPKDKFPDVAKTRWRLALLFYAHLTEMSAPYEVIANLLRVRAGHSYVADPFGHLRRQIGKKNPDQLPVFTEFKEPSPRQKIEELERLAEVAGCQEAIATFSRFYFADIRNAISHSDFAIAGNEFRMLSAPYRNDRRFTRSSHVVPLDELHRIICDCSSFYSAFFRLEKWMRYEIGKHADTAFPFDRELKGLLEILTDDDGLLTGISVHWPNGRLSTFRRKRDGACEITNCMFDEDGRLSFMVGEYFRDHAPFSRLVRAGTEPTYAPFEKINGPVIWPLA